MRRTAAAQHAWWQVVTGADIPIETEIGGGLLLPHPNGIVIHPRAVIGPNCLIFQQVTIGTRDEEGVPIIGGHVDIGAGAKIIGRVRVGNHAKIGANAVVLTDVPEGETVVGIPARIVKPREIAAVLLRPRSHKHVD
jgi:serine O-acetyltransferase